LGGFASAALHSRAGKFSSAALDNVLRFVSAFACAWIVGEAARGDRALRFLRWRPLVAIGMISYRAYVFHLLAFESVLIPFQSRSAS
jgi:peptidoglycan/LPS O-acetylase OafA/YrhL